MPGPLSETVAMVTGVSHGVGKGVALGLGEAGATVYVTGCTTGASPAALPDSMSVMAAARVGDGGHRLHVRTVDEGSVGRSATPGIWAGMVIWTGVGGEWQFTGASGLDQRHLHPDPRRRARRHPGRRALPTEPNRHARTAARR